jgi:hypothetical protein
MAKKTKADSKSKPAKRGPSQKKRPKSASRTTARRPPRKTSSPKKGSSQKKTVAPNPSDKVRPVPEEPVRIQPPPEFVQGRHDPSLEENAAPPHVEETARENAMAAERQRLRKTPERRRPGDRFALDANRWVRQRANEPRGGGQWRTHGHSSVRGR